MAKTFINCACGCLGGKCEGTQVAEITPDVTVNGITQFGAFAAGEYCVQYSHGAFEFIQRGFKWAVTLGGHTIGFDNGNNGFEIPQFAWYPSQAYAEGKVRWAQNFTHTGGLIYFTFLDSFLPDNVPGNPSPTWALHHLGS